MTTFRSRAARMVPASAKQRHEAWSTDRYLRRLAPLNLAYVDDHGVEVRRGPFAGMRYDADFVTGSGDAVAKLVGTYEIELHDAIADWIGGGWERVVNVGAAEGFYAVGFARAMPAAQVLAYDIDPTARARCEHLAALNGVADRVEVLGECTPAAVEDLPPARTALLCDCEGYEATLLDPAAAPALAGWDVLVELHDFIVPGIEATLRERFAATHELETIMERPRAAVIPPELEGLDAADRVLLLSEHRPTAMSWMRLRPR